MVKLKMCVCIPKINHIFCESLSNLLFQVQHLQMRQQNMNTFILATLHSSSFWGPQSSRNSPNSFAIKTKCTIKHFNQRSLKLWVIPSILVYFQVAIVAGVFCLRISTVSKLPLLRFRGCRTPISNTKYKTPLHIIQLKPNNFILHFSSKRGFKYQLL